MFVLKKKKLFFRSAGIIGVLIITIASVFFALKNIETGANAITGEGESVKITREWDGDVEHVIFYSSPDHTTVRFFIQNHAGEKIQAFCRNPNLAGPDRPDPTQPTSSSDSMEIPATRMADNPKQNAIKLLAYLGTVDNSYTAAALNELFQDHPSAFPGQTSVRDERFGFLHAAMGYLEENGNLDFHELTEADKTFVKKIGDKASEWVAEDKDIWALARPYQLFALDRTQFDTSIYQDIVWIEDASTSGNIEVKKCDKESGCTPQGGASFRGISVAVKNNGSKIYYNGNFYARGTIVATGTTDDNGKVTFSNLPAGSYRIEETATNSSYQKDATFQTVTVSSGTKSVQLNDTVVKGSVKVVKHDADSNSCSSQGGASLSGTQFTIYNKTGQPIVYGGASKADDAAIDTKTIDGNCEALFTGLPYGDYSIKETSTGSGYSGDSTEQTFSISSNNQTITKTYTNSVIRGNIRVIKCDTETGCTPQGGASLQNIKFEVYNANDNNVYYKGTAYAKNKLITWDVTDVNGRITFSDLPVGNYTVKESATNPSYTLGGESQTVTVVDGTKDVYFNNIVVKGDLKVTKNDAETGECSNLGKANFSTTKFKLVNNTGGSIVYGNRTIPAGNEVETKTLGADCTISFNDLPYGNYTIQEIDGGVGYQIVVGTPQGIKIATSQGDAASFNNQVIRGDVKFRKMNDETNSPMANVPFRITSKTTGESHIVVTNNNGIINTSTSFIPHSTGTNGYDGYSESEIYSITHKRFGTWFGRIRGTNRSVAVSDILGALPYDDYTIVELHCVKNEYCYEVSEPTEFSIDGSVALIDLGDWTNDCVTHEIDTTASDDADGDKYIEATSNVAIKDVITYRAMKGKNYVIKGVVMDKKTGQPLQINGTTVENTVPIAPVDSEYGETIMTFNLDASSIAGKRLVVFERLFDVDYYNPSGEIDTIGTNGLVAMHTNLYDDDQSINVISIDTTATDNLDGDKYIENIATAEIKDRVDYCLKNGNTYTLKGVIMDKSTNQPVEADGNTVVQTFTVDNPADSDRHNCGYVDMVFHLNAESIAGKDLVVFESIYEGGNPQNPDDPENPGHLVIKHENIYDDDQGINVVFLDTTAMDNLDEDKFVKNDEEAKIRDFVEYCAKAGTRYILKGTVMDKLTGEPLIINESVVEEILDFTDEKNCKNRIMTFTLDAREIAGRELVVFERLYEADKYDEADESDETGQNGLVIKHTDINDDDQSVTIVSLDTIATDSEDDDKFIEAGKTTKIKDKVHYCVKPNTDFRILGYLADGETDEALSFDRKPIEKEIIVNTKDGCGDAEMEYEFDSSELVGHRIVVYNDLYINNHKVLAHESPYDKYQFVTVVSYSTYAKDYRNKTKELPIEEDDMIEDIAKYCLTPGERYILKGTLMDKATGKELQVNGKTISTSYELIVPVGEPCGEVALHYPIDTTGLGGKEIVIFDEVYHDGELIIAHRDVNNTDETVTVMTPPPNTGIITKPVMTTTEESHNYLYLVAILPVLGVAGYITKRIITKRKSISF